jgi:catechol 2,3-dioxygenase-like lactoylglutathione lyase family enzyme
LGWLGIRVSQVEEMKALFRDVLGLPVAHESEDLVRFQLESGEIVEIFGPNDRRHTFFTTGPVAGFQVDSVEQASAELEGAGMEVIGGVQWSRAVEGYGWLSFRGPDGRIYSLHQGTYSEPRQKTAGP